MLTLHDRLQQHGRPVQIVDCGTTEIDHETFEEYLDNMREHYTWDKYHLLDFNCNSFTADVSVLSWSVGLKSLRMV
jgi:hypothetical protein